MASTYSPNLRLELIGTGEQQGTWGSTTNTNLGTLLEEAIGGYVSVTVSDVADTTLTANNGTADQSRNAVINLTGTLTATRNVICPAIEKVYIVKNATTGGFAVTFKVSGQTGVSIPNGSTYIVYVDGTDVRQVTSSTGTIASQNSNNVTITGGSISGTNLSSSNVTITGGTISGLSNLSVANATVASTVRTNLGVAIGSNVQAYDATLQSLSSLGTVADRIAYTTALDTWAETPLTAFGRSLIDDADAATSRTTLGLGSLATLSAVGTSQITDNSVTGAKIALGSDAQGDLMYYNGTDWVRLAAGTSGQYLRTAGAAANPAWATVATGGAVILGDISTASGSSASLGSLTLTDYNVIELWFNDVSHNNGTDVAILCGNSTADDVAVTATGNSGSLFTGIVKIDLADGKGASAVNSGTLGKSATFNTALSTATTTISLAPGGGSFDNGYVRVVGYK